MIGQFTRKTDSSPESRMRQFFLARLQRLVQLSAPTSAAFNSEMLRRRAIYATYVDCRELGLEPEAHQILSTREGAGLRASRP